ncbi:MAG: hypothetical protein ACRCX5_05295 [Bacteroidales bacterium]
MTDNNDNEFRYEKEAEDKLKEELSKYYGVICNTAMELHLSLIVTILIYNHALILPRTESNLTWEHDLFKKESRKVVTFRDVMINCIEKEDEYNSYNIISFNDFSNIVETTLNKYSPNGKVPIWLKGAIGLANHELIK